MNEPLPERIDVPDEFIDEIISTEDRLRAVQALLDAFVKKSVFEMADSRKQMRALKARLGGALQLSVAELEKYSLQLPGYGRRPFLQLDKGKDDDSPQMPEGLRALIQKMQQAAEEAGVPIQFGDVFPLSEVTVESTEPPGEKNDSDSHAA